MFWKTRSRLFLECNGVYNGERKGAKKENAKTDAIADAENQ